MCITPTPDPCNPATFESIARSAAAALVKHRARALAQSPASLDSFSPGLSCALPEMMIAVARKLLDSERQSAQRWFGFGGEVRALNAKALLLLGRARRRAAS